MADISTVARVKNALGISNNSRDRAIADCIDYCKSDLISCGVVYTTAEDDIQIFTAIKLYCASQISESMDIRDRWLERYETVKKVLISRTNYGFAGDIDV